MPAFSYAQAARGLAPAREKEESLEQTTKTTPKSESTGSQPSKQTSTSRSRGEEKEVETATKESHTPSSTAGDSVEKENIAPAQPSQQMSEATPSSATSPNLTGVTGSPREKDLTPRLDGSESWEKASHTSGTADKDSTTPPKDTGKETEDDWEKVSVPSVGGEKDKELKPAPPPTFNFWEQRRKQAADALLAGQRPAAAAQPVHNSAATRPRASVEGAKGAPGFRATLDQEVKAGSKRSNDTVRGNGKCCKPSWN